jgi:hypothetical protein
MIHERRRWLVGTLLALVVVETVLLCWLGRQGQEGFRRLVCLDDSTIYLEVARALAVTGRLIPSIRPPGYPAFLATALAIAGPDVGLIVAIALQLTLNLLFAFLVWRLIENLTPEADPAALSLATLVAGWAGLGMAFLVMSDFLAGLLFTLFVFGFLFARTRLEFAGAGAALMAATLTRPTFTLLPLLLPVLARLAGRVVRPAGAWAVAFFAACSLAATGLSTALQYRVDGYAGPSPVVTENLQRAVERAYSGEPGAAMATREGFEAAITARAGRPFRDLSRSEQERFARALFRETVAARPGRVLGQAATAAVKYLLAPIEAVPALLARHLNAGDDYVATVRPFLAVLCMPLWLLALWPPAGGSRRLAWYAFTILLLGFTLAITALAPMQGERIRFPILALMMPIAVWNARSLRTRLAWRRSAAPAG